MSFDADDWSRKPKTSTSSHDPSRSSTSGSRLTTTTGVCFDAGAVILGSSHCVAYDPRDLLNLRTCQRECGRQPKPSRGDVDRDGKILIVGLVGLLAVQRKPKCAGVDSCVQQCALYSWAFCAQN